MIEFKVSSSQRAEAIEITSKINSRLPNQNFENGVNLWIPHTTAGVTVNESADPNVMADMIEKFDELIPWDDEYTHIEDNAAAHIKTMMLNSHQWLPVNGGSLSLGKWQGVFLLEWDGPRSRKIQLYDSD